MEHSKSLWRGLFFILLITALCGGLVLPAISGTARAAPPMQVTACLGTTIAQWTFEGDVITPSVGTGTFNVGSGLPTATFAGSASNRAVSFSSWPSSLDSTAYIELVVPTSGRNSIGITVDYRSTSTAPTTLELHYSTDGVNFTIFNSPSTLIRDATFHSLSFNLGTITGLDDNANVAFRLYGYGATTAGGTLRLDNITLTGNCLTYLTDTAIAANSTGTVAAANATGTAASNLTATSIALSNTPTATSTGIPTFTPTATSLSSGSATSVVISEFRTTGPAGANDEFIEIYNPTNTAIDISGWILSASNSSGGTQTRATIPASTLLRSGQYYLVANNGYTNTSVPANLNYGTGISNDGGIALLTSTAQIVDEVGMDPGSAYQEGTPLSQLTNANRSYERKDGDPSGSCVDTNDNSSDFSSVSPSPHNYSTIRFCNGTSGPSLSTTTTTITADIPDPSLVNANVTITVRVTGGSTIPTGKVNITGANTNCSLNLNAGIGSCTVKFTSNGTKGLIATYLGDNTHASSTDGESHLVGTSNVVPTPTRRPTLLPPPPLVGINEFVPRPGHDWNNDGVINVGDEYIELLNHGVIDVNLSGYSLDDEVNIGSNPYRLPSITLKPGERHVFYGSETGLLLSDGGDGVRLLKPNGQLEDAYNYFVVRFPDQSYCLLPDNG